MREEDRPCVSCLSVCVCTDRRTRKSCNASFMVAAARLCCCCCSATTRAMAAAVVGGGGGTDGGSSRFCHVPNRLRFLWLRIPAKFCCRTLRCSRLHRHGSDSVNSRDPYRDTTSAGAHNIHTPCTSASKARSQRCASAGSAPSRACLRKRRCVVLVILSTSSRRGSSSFTQMNQSIYSHLDIHCRTAAHT